MSNPANKVGGFSILAVDGGGTRGIYAAQILARVEEALGQTVKDCFDLLAGTSTGSIIAGAAAAGIPLGEVVDLFERESPRIFGKARFPSRISVFLRSRYSQATLEKVLQEYLPQNVLRDISTGPRKGAARIPAPKRPPGHIDSEGGKSLLITSADISTGGVHVFKSRYLGDLGEPYERDGDVLLREAILASCAAPTYFDPKAVGPYLLTDGGLWANNPSIIALTEAISKFKKGVEEVRIFSIGTGHTTTMYTKRGSWGLLTGWGGNKLVSYTLGLQSQASTNMAKLILGDRYLRLDPEIDSWELDDTRHLANLKGLAERDFTYRSKTILGHIRRDKE